VFSDGGAAAEPIQLCWTRFAGVVCLANQVEARKMIAWGKIPKIVSWGREIQNNKLLTKGKVAGKGTASAKSHVEICSHLMRYQKGD
jgi:hypothetical protein